VKQPELPFDKQQMNIPTKATEQPAFDHQKQ
jgi:hypothetical protein